jgi:hypothetical protein
MRRAAKLMQGAQYTALVDILFATTGVFVIVFALQDVVPPVRLQPAPYMHLVICHDAERLGYMRGGDEVEAALGRSAVSDGTLAERLQSGGRVLVALGPACVEATDQRPLVESLRELEATLGNRLATTIAPLVLFEFAPLGTGPNSAEALVRRFQEGLPQ